MIIPLLILFYSFIKRFPGTVLLIYCVSLFGGQILDQEKEVEKEVVETSSRTTQQVLKKDKPTVSISAVQHKHYPNIEQPVRAKHQFVVTTFLKLYILYNNFSSDRRSGQVHEQLT